MPYYGQRPSGQQLQQAPGGNPFYNPYSPYPNIGAGISSILQNVMAHKQFQEQQTYDRDQEAQSMALKERQVAAQEQSAIRPTLEWQFKIAAYKTAKPITDGHPTNDYEAIKGVKEAETIYKKSANEKDIDALVAIGVKPTRAARLAILGRKKKPTEKVPRESLQRGRDKELVGKLASGVKYLREKIDAKHSNLGGRKFTIPGQEKEVQFFDGIAMAVAEIQNALTGGELSPEDRKRAKLLNTLISSGGPSEEDVTEINKQAAIRKMSPKETFMFWVNWKAGIR
jgi:hypothetical protein